MVQYASIRNDVLAILLLTCILQDLITLIETNNCVVGQENNHAHNWRWVLHDDDPCSCRSVTFGGANLMTAMQTSKTGYFEKPMATTEYVSIFMKLYDLDCMNLTCPLPKVVKTDQGKATAMVWWLGPVPTDTTDYVYKAICYPPSGTNFTIGISQVVCKAVDRRGITKTCNFDIKVEDNQAPALASCPAIEPKNTDPGEVTALITWEGPVAIDNSGGIPTVTCYPPSGTNFTIGQSPVTCTAVDISGNQESCIFYVDVT
ncbi:sushi, von Willebrand factor type A, EGF and pentraxin domain-containing protein 1-like, partial [Amphiura filiformis]|uniref:sushi, von Willebrand factor type A, EGF and pentraxin domain-containing protein 1-like n=1 Tax=Amphiura filiformis TaxID=82378 RepID=UPI003B21D388